MNSIQRILIGLGLLLAGGAAQAQITLTVDDFGSVGDIVPISDVSQLSGVTPGAAGANVVWDFSGLTPDTTYNDKFILPGDAAGADKFPAANLALMQMRTDTSVIFINKKSDGIWMLGVRAPFGQGVHLTIPFAPAYQLAVFPATYQTKFNRDFSFNITASGKEMGNPGVDSMMIMSKQHHEIVFDGWGTLKLPENRTVEALRARSVQFGRDSSRVKIPGLGWTTNPGVADTTIDYTWYGKNCKDLLMSLQTDAAGVPNSVTYTGLPVTARAPLSESRLGLAPNPAADRCRLSWPTPGPATVRLLDVTGRVLYQTLTQDNSLLLDLTAWPAGLYVAQVTDAQGGEQTQRLLIAR